MTINITWVDNCEGEEKVERLHTPVCTIKIHRRQDVITNIEWDFSQDADKAENNCKQLADFWPEPKQAINIKLLKQGTAHQNKVWAELLKIPLGSTLTYSALAKKSAPLPVLSVMLAVLTLILCLSLAIGCCGEWYGRVQRATAWGIYED